MVTLLCLLCAHYLLFLAMVLYGIRRVKKRVAVPAATPFVTVVVPFRNEELTLPGITKCLTRQEYPKDKFEVILVNDHSTDGSLKVLAWLKLPDNFKVITAPEAGEGVSPKKNAITAAVQSARGEIIVTTDADCLVEPRWLATIAAWMPSGVTMLVAPVMFTPGSSLFGRMQSLEFTGLLLTAAGLIGNNTPFLASGANFAYRKEQFLAIGGFGGGIQLSSGDDELLLQRFAKSFPGTIAFAWDPALLVSTAPNPTVSRFFQQRRRWASKSLFYQDKLFIARLVLIFFFFFFTLLAVPALLLGYAAVAGTALAVLLLKAAAELFILLQGKGLFYKKFDIPAFLAAEMAHIPYIVVSALLGVAGNFEWKGRERKR